MRILGIDYGKKRVGLAISDETGSVAFPYKVLSNNKDLVRDVGNVCKEENVGLVVIGASRTLSGKDNPIMKEIKTFKDRLLQESYLDIQLEPEFFSTVEATRFQKETAYVDASAAAIILQRYLDKPGSQGV